MCGTTNPINVRGVPCALKPHLNEGVSRKVLGSLSQHGCKSSFLDWVKNFRRDAPDIEEEELLMCPMLWCRTTFKDADATVRHVFGCPRLTNGWYWCPYCKRPERFLECDRGCDIPRLQKREPKLAITFFRWLGRRSSSKKIVDSPGKVESEGTARDERIRRVGQGSSHDEKVKYPDTRSGATEIAGSDMFRPEHPSLQRVNVRSLYEMFVSTPFDRTEAGSDSIDYRELDPQAFVTPPLVDLCNASVPTNLELPTVDPVYWTAELRDRASCNIADAPTATSSTTSRVLQAESSWCNTPGRTDTLGESFIKSSDPFDEQWFISPFHDSYEDFANVYPSTPSLGLHSPVPQTASPSTPTLDLISQLSSAVTPSSRASALISPMSKDGSPTSRTQEDPGVNAIKSSEDCINVWGSQSSTLPPPKPKETGLQGHPAKPSADTTSASDSTDHQWYSSRKRRQIPLQIQNLGGGVQDHKPHLRAQVEELQGLVRIVNNEWMQRLLPSSELHLRCSSLSARTLFVKGIRTLQAWLRGNHERTFEEVFSFMHIAFAAAYILHHEDKSYCWDAFLQDALQLRHALADREGELLFLLAMDRAWGLSNQQISTSNADPRPSIICSTSQERSYGIDQAALLQGLRDNKVFRVCAGFLDDFEEAVVLEKNMSLHSAAVAAGNELPRIGEGMEKIIRPLEQIKGIEAFQANLRDVSVGIIVGILHDIREVEVALVSSGRRSSYSPEVFERFQSLVATQCNAAMGSSNPMWRDQYYIADLTNIMDISDGVERHQGLDLASKRWLDSSVLAIICPSGESLGSPTSPSSLSTGPLTVGSSPTSLTTRTSQDDEFSTPMTSPTTASQASISPTSPAFNSSTFNSSTSNVETCPICGKRFQGTLSNARSNLNRHLRTSPRHNKDAGLRCPEPRCDAKPMRSDNLGPHLKRSHGLTSRLEIEQAIKKSRRLNTVPDA